VFRRRRPVLDGGGGHGVQGDCEGNLTALGDDPEWHLQGHAAPGHELVIRAPDGDALITHGFDPSHDAAQGSLRD